MNQGYPLGKVPSIFIKGNLVFFIAEVNIYLFIFMLKEGRVIIGRRVNKRVCRFIEGKSYKRGIFFYIIKSTPHIL